MKKYFASKNSSFFIAAALLIFFVLRIIRSGSADSDVATGEDRNGTVKAENQPVIEKITIISE